MFQCSLILILRNERNSNSPQIFLFQNLTEKDLKQGSSGLFNHFRETKAPWSSIPPFIKKQQLVTGEINGLP